MKRCVNFSKKAVCAGLLAGLATVLSAAAAPVAQPSAPDVVTRSVFVVPKEPKDGCDPFFPNSTRPYEIVSAARPHSADMSSLVLRGISGPPNHRLAIINSHTFGAGDEANLATPQGPIHIRCIEVKENSVVIESGGQRHELNYANNR
jgi:hypothetical protein